MDSNTTLITGALDQFMRHSLTGCEKAALQAAPTACWRPSFGMAGRRRPAATGY